MDKIYEELLEKFTNDKHKCLHYKKLLSEIEGDITTWQPEDVDRFLFNLHSTSHNSLNKYLRSLRYIHEYTCEKKNIPCKILKPSYTVKNYIDYPKLRSQIITYDDYRFIRNELDFYLDGQRVNLRDKIIFELAWEGLSASEIQYLKENQIEFIDKKIKIQLPKRIIWITDLVVIEDIKDCLKERKYYQINSDGRVKEYDYKDTEYLIKSIQIRSDIFDRETAGVSTMFGRIMNRVSLGIGRKSLDWDSTAHDLEIESLTIKNIRRSKMIYLLQFQYITSKGIQVLFGKKQWTDISWLTQISKMVYGDKTS